MLVTPSLSKKRFQYKITLILAVWLGTLPKLFLFEGSVSTEGLMERHIQCGCVTGQSAGIWKPWSILIYLRACFCKPGKTSGSYPALFTLGFMKLIRPK